MAHVPSVQAEELKSYRERFDFGKMVRLDASGVDYIGRRLRRLPDRILVDQENYILEQIHRLPLPRARRSNHDEPLVGREISDFRSM
eukprot:8992306-Pyramimonas_sp.AAC.1